LNTDANPYRAIILSAGRGGRLLPLTERLPKCLLDVGGRSLLAWQLRALAEAGVREAVVVTGYGSEFVDLEIERHAPSGMRVRALYNPFFQVADNLASCWIARAEMSGPFLILNGDTLIQAGIARRLLAAPPAPITVTIDRKAAYDEDDMKVVADGERLTAIGKTLTSGDVNGESIGFLRFDAAGGAQFVAEVERSMRVPAGLRRWYLSAINDLAGAGVDVRVVSIEGLQWGEIDYPADLARCRTIAAGWSAREPADGAAPVANAAV
jgi:choline kinase